IAGRRGEADAGDRHAVDRRGRRLGRVCRPGLVPEALQAWRRIIAVCLQEEVPADRADRRTDRGRLTSSPGMPQTAPRFTDVSGRTFAKLAERVGFEPTVPKGYNGFRDRPVRPLRHLSAPDRTAGPAGLRQSSDRVVRSPLPAAAMAPNR